MLGIKTEINNSLILKTIPSKLSYMSQAKLVIIIPVYEDVDSARILLDKLKEQVGDFRIVAVDDGSLSQPLDGTLLETPGVTGVVIKLRRNLGHQGAIAVGLCYVNQHMRDHEHVVVMDSDGEDTPESIKDLLEGFTSSSSDVRVAERNKRNESLKFKLFYRVYKFLFSTLTGKSINFGNFMVLKPRAVARLSSMSEIWIHLAASVISSKLFIDRCKIDRGVRYVGVSKMNFVNLVLHGFKGIMVFSEQVLIRTGVACLVVAVVAVAVVALALMLKLHGTASPGWLSTVVGFMLVIFIQTSLLTMITLMITGVVKVATLNQIDFNSFIDEVIEVK